MVDEICIIIPTLNEEKYIGRLLTSICKQNYKGKLQVIIVDGNSEDKTVEIIQKYSSKIPDVTIIPLKKRGISLQRNKGAEKAKYRYLLFLDADVVLPKNFISKILSNINPGENFIATSLPIANDMDFLTILVALFVYPVGILGAWIGKATSGFCILTTSESHKKIHGFREELMYGEDIDYGKRLMAQGAKFYFYWYPYILFSVRRLKQMGRLKWVYMNFKNFVFIKQKNADHLQDSVNYPYGQF